MSALRSGLCQSELHAEMIFLSFKISFPEVLATIVTRRELFLNVCDREPVPVLFAMTCVLCSGFLFQSAFALGQGNTWEMGLFEMVSFAIAFQ